jgi:drug/metabolite transporter (DMT)-like permease
MIFSANLLGILFALASACLGGGGDFIGGWATRRSGPLPVLALSSLSGLVFMLVCALAWREALPSPGSIGWAIAAGVVGVLGMAALYRGLSLGNAASVAPTSAVIAAALPVVFTAFVDGWPAATRLAGFGLALLGIWIVSQPATPAGASLSRHGLLLACSAGLGFGFFFILLGQVAPGQVFMPLVFVRCMALITVLVFMRAGRVALPAVRANLDAGVIGVVDGLGTVLFLLARQFTRLDVAVVLTSLYPAVTMLLASLVQKEAVSPRQWAGALLCLAAIVLITL